MAEETDYWKAKLAKFTPKQFSWSENATYHREAEKALDNLKFTMEEGVLLKYRLLREKELDKYISTNCYGKGSGYNYLQAIKCEEYHYENDYKLNLIGSFLKDHTWKHILAYHNCTRTNEFNRLKTIEEKDRVYLGCHTKFMTTIQEKLPAEFAEKAKELFQSSD